MGGKRLVDLWTRSPNLTSLHRGLHWVQLRILSRWSLHRITVSRLCAQVASGSGEGKWKPYSKDRGGGQRASDCCHGPAQESISCRVFSTSTLTQTYIRMYIKVKEEEVGITSRKRMPGSRKPERDPSSSEKKPQGSHIPYLKKGAEK